MKIAQLKIHMEVFIPWVVLSANRSSVGKKATRKITNCLRYRAICLVWILLVPQFISLSYAKNIDSKREYLIEIPALTLDMALGELAKQTGTQTLFPYDLLSLKQAPAIQGLFTLKHALQQLLDGTGFSSQITARGVVTVLPDATYNNVESQIIMNSSEQKIATNNIGNNKRKANKSSKGLLAALIGIFAGAGGAPVNAQDASNTETKNSYRLIEEVLVTATRRESGIQDTAMSVNACSGEQLAKNGYTSIGQVLDSIPGVTSIASGPNENRIIIRNVATSTQEAGSATSATYFDDFVVSGVLASAAEIRLVDMQRIEVLKGPQGTLFGRSAMGGIVRYISNKPDPEAFAAGINTYVSSTTDGGDNIGGHGYINLPINDSLALRLVAYSYQHDGFIDNVELGVEDFNEEDTVGGRAALRWQPTDQFTLDLTYINQEIDGAPNWVTTIHSAEGDIPFDVERRDQVAGIAQQSINEHEILNFSASYEFDTFTATLLATRSEETFNFVFDQREYVGVSSGCVCDFLDSGDRSNIDTDIIEFRLVSQSNSAFDWIVGAYYEDSGTNGQQLIRYFGEPQLALGFIPLTNGSVQIDTGFQIKESESAIYGELGYSISEATHVTFGYRRSDVEFGRTTTRANGIFDFLTGTTALVGIPFDTQEDVDTYKVSLEHSVNEDLFVYFTATSGYRRGGFNTPTFIAPFSTFDSDSLWNYEIGVKSTWLDGRLVANASLYFLDWSDIQLVVQDPVTFVRATENVGKAEIPGFEFSLAYQLTDTLDVSFSGSLSNPELKEDVPGGVSGKKGDTLPGSADENFAVMANWNKPLDNGLGLFATATYKYVGKRLNDFNTDLDVGLSSYSLMDARAGFNSPRGYSVSVYANNLFDEAIEYVIDRQGPFFESVPTNRPRTVGLNLIWDF